MYPAARGNQRKLRFWLSGRIGNQLLQLGLGRGFDGRPAGGTESGTKRWNAETLWIWWHGHDTQTAAEPPPPQCDSEVYGLRSLRRVKLQAVDAPANVL